MRTLFVSRRSAGLITIRFLALLGVFLAVACRVEGGALTYFYDFNDNCNRAYSFSMSLHFKEASEILTKEKQDNPRNLMAVYVADYEDCIILMLNGDKTEYEKRIAHLDERIDQLDKGDEYSPWRRYCKAGVYLHWALVNLQFGEQLKAAVKFRKSFALLRENERMFPSFEYNKVFAGLQEAAVGSLPGSYKWIAAVFGMNGSIKNGTAKLAGFVNTHSPGQPLYSETLLFYLFTRFYLAGEQKEAADFINSTVFITRDNLLNTYVKVNLLLDYHKTPAAIATLKAAETDSSFLLYPILSYQMGIALLEKGDMACYAYFQNYLKYNKSDMYIKDCWQKSAFSWYLNGDLNRAEYCRRQAGSQGFSRIDVDRQAKQFAAGRKWPVKELLRARLLTDGGYTMEAFDILRGIPPASITDPAEKAEYYYRLGRVYQESSDFARALEYFRYAINAGKTRHEQFAARAALQMGLIYEHTGKGPQAIASYKECLEMPGHDFQNSIDQQAKSGINRVGD
jgi:tetratricopeptide (TPR) repeat protein